VIFAETDEQRHKHVETPEAQQRFPKTMESDIHGIRTAPKCIPVRGPVGGSSSVVLGSDVITLCKDKIVVETPDATVRFPQVRTASSISFQGQGDGPNLTTVRGPVGGASTVVLGTCPVTDIQPELTTLETPQPAPRFQAPPGGKASICLSSEPVPSTNQPAIHQKTTRVPAGGHTSLVLGLENGADMFEGAKHMQTLNAPCPLPRFSAPPGGDATICLGANNIAHKPHEVRGPAGGKTSIVLGSDDAASITRKSDQSTAMLHVPEAAPRFPQTPGGTSVIGHGCTLTGVTCRTRGDVGGPASLSLIHEGPAVGLLPEPTNVGPTPEPARRFQQPPGGKSTVLLGVDPNGSDRPSRTVVPGEVRAEEDSSKQQQEAEFCAEGSSKHDKVEENVSSGENKDSENTSDGSLVTRVQHAPGAQASLVLGASLDVMENPHQTQFEPGCAVLKVPDETRDGDGGEQIPKMQSTIPAAGSRGNASSANKFASGTKQNSGNFLTERSTTRLHQAPGGKSTVCLGMDVPDVESKCRIRSVKGGA